MRFSRQRKAPVNLTLPLTEMLAKVGSAIVRDRPRLYGNNCLCDRLRSSAIVCDHMETSLKWSPENDPLSTPVNGDTACLMFSRSPRSRAVYPSWCYQDQITGKQMRLCLIPQRACIAAFRETDKTENTVNLPVCLLLGKSQSRSTDLPRSYWLFKENMEGGRRQSVLERRWRSVCFQNLFYLQLGKYRTG